MITVSPVLTVMELGEKPLSEYDMVAWELDGVESDGGVVVLEVSLEFDEVFVFAEGPFLIIHSAAPAITTTKMTNAIIAFLFMPRCLI